MVSGNRGDTMAPNQTDYLVGPHMVTHKIAKAIYGIWLPGFNILSTA
ncbi:hypothetical protein [Dyadobacter sp. 3J3]|nr:hypothetical protein [Dyadobacter sp. 3J3]